MNENLTQLLDNTCGQEERQFIIKHVHMIPVTATQHPNQVSRDELCLALNLLLFLDLLKRVPDGHQYVIEQAQAGRKVFFDHGALRTIDYAEASNIPLPSGHKAFARILEPLGYTLVGTYPLDRIKMCGFVYQHLHYPEFMPQYFVSEIYPDQFSPEFQLTVKDVTAETKDPLLSKSISSLKQLEKSGYLDLSHAADLLNNLLACFDRPHPMPSWLQYTQLLDESPEMAWISTEGNAFNHATDRVENLDVLVDTQRKLNRNLKPAIEEGQNANIRQTAYRANNVKREFQDPHAVYSHEVPGSFFEFIQRGWIEDPDSGKQVLDLRFDSRNAQGIFKMTKA